MYIGKGDLARYGYSEGCAKCDRLRAGRPASGFRHSEACRRRIERELREAGDRRIAAAERRIAERVIEVGGDPSVPAEPAAAMGPEPAGEGLAGPEDAQDAAPRPVPVRLPQSMAPGAPAEPMDALPDEPMGSGGGEGSMEVETGGMMGALLRLASSMLPDLRKEVDDLLLLYALNGVPDEPAAKAIAELYSPPRVTAELKELRRRCPGMALVPGATFDLYEDEQGVAYDVLKAVDCQRIRARASRDRPPLSGWIATVR